MSRLRVATYNVHKCRGLDRKTIPERIAQIVHALDADVIGLQEVLDVRNDKKAFDQARIIASVLSDYEWNFGANRSLHGGAYGNMTLSRLPIESSQNYLFPHVRRELRGCLRTDLRFDSFTLIHAFNLHLGTGFVERRRQAQYLLTLLDKAMWPGPRVIFGDFNEWTRGLTSERMADTFDTFEPATMLMTARTYPGLVPFLHLDHFYYDPALHLEHMELVRNRETLTASDHLPLIADFSL